MEGNEGGSPVTYHISSTREEIVKNLRESFEISPERDLTQYYENIANVFLAGNDNATPSQICDALFKVTAVWFSKDVILPPESKGEKWDQLYMRYRLSHLSNYFEQVKPEDMLFIAMFQKLFTNIVWNITLDENFTSIFEQETEIPYQWDEEEPALV